MYLSKKNIYFAKIDHDEAKPEINLSIETKCTGL